MLATYVCLAAYLATVFLILRAPRALLAFLLGLQHKPPLHLIDL